MNSAQVVDLRQVRNSLVGRDFKITESVRPPFSSTFIEFTSGGLGDGVLGQARYGVLVTPFEPESDGYEVFANRIGERPPVIQTLDNFLETAKGILYIGTMVWPLDTDYKMFSGGRGYALLNADPPSYLEPIWGDEIYTMLKTYSLIAGYGLELMNCMNVELIENAPNADESAAYERHFGAPMAKYKTLALKSLSKRTDRDDKPQQQFDVMPLHLRRGNFAHYTADAPLFGKYVGTFWRPSTVVGSKKNGIVDKDYKVQP